MDESGFKAPDDFADMVESFTGRADCDFAACTVLGLTAAAAGQTELAERLYAGALEDRPGFALAHVGWGADAAAGLSMGDCQGPR